MAAITADAAAPRDTGGMTGQLNAVAQVDGDNGKVRRQQGGIGGREYACHPH